MNIIFGFIFFTAMTLVMTIGLWFGRKPIAGTCGGLNNLKKLRDTDNHQDLQCSFCGKTPDQIREQPCVTTQKNTEQ